jgi:hypothetical protein
VAEVTVIAITVGFGANRRNRIGPRLSPRSKGYGITEHRKETGEGHERLARRQSRDRRPDFLRLGRAAHGPAILEAWVEEVDQTRVLVRTAASPVGDVTGNGQGTRWLHQPKNFVVVKGQGFA